MLKTSRNTLVVDAYNANPSSVEAALANFSRMQAPSRMVMLGDMLELGEDSVKEHVAVVRKALGCGLDRIFVVGSEFGKALDEIDYEGEEIMHFSTSDDLAGWKGMASIEGSVILIKGSRGTRMENVIEKL